MRLPTAETRFVTFIGTPSGFRNSFFQLVEQVIDNGVEDVRYQTAPRFRLWVNNPICRQVIFLEQRNWKDVQGRGASIIPMNDISDFLKNRGRRIAPIR